MKFFSLLLHFLAILFLTVLTQVGGFVYLLLAICSVWTPLSKWKFMFLFFSLYLMTTLLIIPKVAPLAGRVALPLSGNLQPLTPLTFLLNRHYVRPNARNEMLKAAEMMVQKFPGTTTCYLDANFPFFDNFPLFPHLSHDDGKKLDLAFYYMDRSTGAPIEKSPSFIGYGIYDDPLPNEADFPRKCAEEGFWQYGIIRRFVPKSGSDQYQVDPVKTRELIRILATFESTSKIFIEPHLVTRWNLKGYKKVRYHGCHAVRHDDHIHWQTHY